MTRKLGLVVAEYKINGKCAGGLDSVAEFIVGSFLPENGWNVEVASPRMSRRAEESRQVLNPRSWLGPRQRRAVIDGVPVVYFGASIAEFEISRYAPRGALTRFLDSCDAVVVVAGSPAIVNTTSRTKRPVVAQVATLAKLERTELMKRQGGFRQCATKLITLLVNRLDVRALQIADVVLVENTELYSIFKQMQANVSLLAPGVDCSTFHPGQKCARPGQILSVGRWGDPRKDLDSLLRAYSTARDRHGVLQRLIIAGVESPTPAQIALISELDLESHVTILVDVPIIDLASLYRASDLFVLTSTEEGLGLVFLEAMASGTPVLATATAGAGYAVGVGQAGDTVRLGPDLVHEFAEAMGVWCNDVIRLQSAGLAARRNALERFDSLDVGARFRATVEQLLDDDGLSVGR